MTTIDSKDQDMTESPTNFSHDALAAVVVRDARAHPITETTIVVNLAPTPARIDEKLGGYIAPLSSTLMTGSSVVTGDLLILLTRPGEPLDEEHFRALGWEDFYGSDEPGAAPTATVLLKSAQDRIGTVRLIPADVLHDDDAPASPRDFDVRVNLWFSPAGTDCGIHREHPFIETHSQVMGIGRMQKFRDNAHETIYEDQVLSPGQTQSSIFGRWHDGRLAYPWHQYRADTDVVWLAIEYHPVDALPDR